MTCVLPFKIFILGPSCRLRPGDPDYRVQICKFLANKNSEDNSDFSTDVNLDANPHFVMPDDKG